MKQRRHKKKSKYWHRNIGRKGYRQRYMRQVFEDPDVNKSGTSYKYVEADEHWNIYDPYNYSYDYTYEIFEKADYYLDYDQQQYNLGILLNDILSTADNPFLNLNKKLGIPDHPGKEEFTVVSSDPKNQSTPIHERLFKFVRRITNLSSDEISSVSSWIQNYIGNPRNIPLVKQVEENVKNLKFTKIVCLFAPFWLRSPLTWDKKEKINIIDHLFVLYDVPEFLYNEWFREGNELRFKWLMWFLLLGQGGSLKKGSDDFQWRIPSRFQKYLWDVPADASPIEACIYAEVMRLGGSESDFVRLLRNPSFVVDPTEFSANESHEKFWYDTVRWLIAQSDQITDEQSGFILEWAMHEYTEAELGRMELGRGGPFSWKGRRLRRVLEQSLEYYRQRSLPYSNYKWNKHGWDWEYEEAHAHKWTFVELTSGEELYLEGKAMRHCVSSYDGRCASGYSAIVSLRYNGGRKVTIELNPRTKQIVQARGAHNKEATDEEKSVIASWMKEVVRVH